MLRVAGVRTRTRWPAPESDTALLEGPVHQTHASERRRPAAGPRTHSPPRLPPRPPPVPHEAGCGGTACRASGAAGGSDSSVYGHGHVDGAPRCPSAGMARRVGAGAGAWRATSPVVASQERWERVRPLLCPSGGSEALKSPLGSRSSPARSGARARDELSDRTSASPRQTSARRWSHWRNGARQTRWTSSSRDIKNRYRNQ